ncbi:MAG: DUF5060 domain-containing protein [Puniceicoccaceae bacterium]
MKHTISLLTLLFTFVISAGAAEISGELKKWHKVTLDFEGPECSETGEVNPFMDYRLNVLFKHSKSGKSYLVPGYFAADGNAGETGATSGNVWRVHFAPDETGTWEYTVEFKKDHWIAVRTRSEKIASGEYMDGETGTLKIAKSDKPTDDFRSKGRLKYVGKRYLEFADSGEIFYKCGPDAPENFLSYADFDGTFHNDGIKDDLVKTWEAHLGDWNAGDPTWKNGKGKAMIGALNYLASEQMNSVSFLTNNVNGDDKNAFPYIDYNTFDRMDCSKLDQWEVVFTHAQSLGIFLHFKTLEHENQGHFDSGGVGVNTKLYYRELIARFGHHLALNWNLCEEIGDWGKQHSPPLSPGQRVVLAQWVTDTDPYDHHLVIHNGNWYTPLYGDKSTLTGASLQTNMPDFSRVHSQVKKVLDEAKAAGKIWAVACDEPGDAQHSLITDEEDPEHFDARTNGLWGTFLAGGWGTEWYFGYKHPHSDLTCQDYRSRDLFWDQGRACLDFWYSNDLPVNDMECIDELVSGENNFCLAEPGNVYVALLKKGGKQTLDLSGQDGNYSVSWFDTKAGGKLQKGKVKSIKGGKEQSLGAPPSDPTRDWVVLVKRM